ncbi:MAG: molybdopterin-synthase adenylyltransferase MoeB [SAR324 cluster bacterium]|nr:molybdopterin-synthase adenylyltransferase MoeB [SAR324 cluster bacterium]
MELTHEEISRYSRHLRLPQVGIQGQIKLKSSRVLIVGAGGLGCPIGLYLGAAGVGTIGIVDFDVVDLSNLQRQIAYTVDDIGKPKVEQLKRTIQAANPTIKVEVYNHGITNDNAVELFSQYDIIVDGSDNFNTRYLVNDAAYLAKKPLIYGSIYQFQGQMTVFDPHNGSPCYRCLYSNPPPKALVPNCAEGGVLGLLPGIVGLVQAAETVKALIGIGKTLASRLLIFDALRMTFKDVKIQKDPDCALCSAKATIHELQDYETFCNVHLPGFDEEEDKAFDEAAHTITAPELEEMINDGEEMVLLDVREPSEWEICHIENAKLVPLSDIDQEIANLDKDTLTIAYCHVGERSLEALKKLVRLGFTKAKHLGGGIDQWADIVDPSLPKY